MGERSTESVLNMEALNETFMNNMDIIKQVLSSFKGSFESFENDFLAAQRASDLELMSRLAHGLKGSAGNIRAEKLSLRAAELQEKIDQGQSPGVLAEEVIGGLSKLLKEIEELVSA